MEIGEWTKDGQWPATPELNSIYREIRALGLETNLAELEAFGFTVVRDALSPELTKKLREAVLQAAEKKIDRKLDLKNETELEEDLVPSFLLYKNPAFEEALLNPGPLALISYLLGYSCLLSSVTSHVKGPGKVGLLLHSDNTIGMPAPFPSYGQYANCNYALTDYTKEAGALAMLPGSHRYHRQPAEYENKIAGNDRNPHVVPVEVPAGTAIIWHANTWHGSFPRTMPGLRVSLAYFFCRPYLTPYEPYANNAPPELLKRHGRDSRMAQLLNLNSYLGWKEEGPEYDKIYKLRTGQTWQS